MQLATVRERQVPYGSLTEQAFGVSTVELSVSYDPGWMCQFTDDVSRVALLPSNWDGYGARPLSEKAAYHAIELLVRLGFGGPAPRVSCSPNGDLQLAWSSGNTELELEVNEAGDVDVFLVVGEDEREWTTCAFDLDEDLVDALALVGHVDR